MPQEVRLARGVQVDPLRVAVVGAGYFGCYHCEKMQRLPGVALAAVVDTDAERAGRAAARFGCRPLAGHGELAGRVDAAVVAVPSPDHHAVAADLLRAGIDLLVEKPLATSLAAADELCRLAEQHATCLQVGHLERFNPILEEALGRLRQPHFVRMERLGPYPGRGSEADVVFELMCHDLDILLQVTRAELRSVTASGWPVVSRRPDVAAARLEFADGLVAELTASRVSSRRVRAFSVLDADGLLEVDLAGRRLRRNSFDQGRQHTESMDVAAGDPLWDQDRAFVDVLTNGRRPLVCGRSGRAVVELAERILACIEPAAGS